MKLRNKKTGEIDDVSIIHSANKIKGVVEHEDGVQCLFAYTLKEFNEEWTDYEEPKKYAHVLPNKVRRALLSWVKAQDNPIEKIGILCKSYYDTHEVDSDGFYDYEFYGYVGNRNKNLTANNLSIRLKKPFDFERHKDYTLLELGIMGISGGEE